MTGLKFLSRDLRERILGEAFQLLERPGVLVGDTEAIDLLERSGARVDRGRGVAFIPEATVRRALETVPREFFLCDRDGAPRVRYGGDAVHFDPGSSAVKVLDTRTGDHRPGTSDDLARLVKIAESLPQFDAQSTALVCSDVPKEMGDLYRLYIVLMHSRKPVVTGAFTTTTLPVMLEMIAADSGAIRGTAAPSAGDAPAVPRARAVFDVCPSPPLNWSDFAARTLILLARAMTPAQMVSMPLAGATAPATIAGSLVQHAAECLSGIVIHQAARPGAPIVWGGAPAIFDMRFGTTPMGAMETALIDASYAEVGKSLGLPTHAYLGASDAKILDAQAGMEAGMTALVAAIAGINMVSGAGMLDFLACQSPEKLVFDAEGIAMARRLLAGVEARETPLATHLFAALGHRAGFLELKHTREFFRLEQAMPSAVIDRASVRAWEDAGRPDTAARARERVGALVAAYRRPEIGAEAERGIRKIVEAAARRAGLGALPAVA
jgi:trimethylamine--corrinoid protein Co-methyltransferase